MIADDAEQVRNVKRGLPDAYRHLQALDWDTLLLAHALAIVQGGREALRGFSGWTHDDERHRLVSAHAAGLDSPTTTTRAEPHAGSLQPCATPHVGRRTPA